jgi:ketosteroid isomerase-like protein
MKDDEVILKVQNVNTQFYRAFESLSIEMMEKMWKHDDDDDNAVCIHPGWDLFTGWLAIRESWITIFRNTEMIKFVITNTKVRVFNSNNNNSNDIAVVVCLENIESSVNGQIVKMGVVATNIFELNGERWLLIHHHGSSVSNYIPPNVPL